LLLFDDDEDARGCVDVDKLTISDVFLLFGVLPSGLLCNVAEDRREESFSSSYSTPFRCRAANVMSIVYGDKAIVANSDRVVIDDLGRFIVDVFDWISVATGGLSGCNFC